MNQLMQYGAKPGLERIECLARLLGQPQDKFPVLHVAGTNGKGSTCLMLSRVLSACGYRTGLFVSPHVHSYRERIQVDGEMISADDLARCLRRVDDLLPELLAEGLDHPTEFEVLTAAAFLYFAEREIELAVIEVGMGGLYDSTNVVHPLVSVITNIEFDHMAFLGSTLEEIATNKAGIIKPGMPVVTGETKPEALRVLGETARHQNSELLLVPELVTVEVQASNLEGQQLLVSGLGMEARIALSLPGAYQRDNLALVWGALACLRDQGYHIDLKRVQEALADCHWPGRLEVISRQPLVILDAGHNEAGARALRQSLAEMLPDREKVVVLGILDDKDAGAFLRNLPEKTRVVIITRPDSPRAQGWRQRAELARRYFEQVMEVEAIEDAVAQGLTSLRPQEALVITGSFYVIDRARKYLAANFG